MPFYIVVTVGIVLFQEKKIGPRVLTEVRESQSKMCAPDQVPQTLHWEMIRPRGHPIKQPRVPLFPP